MCYALLRYVKIKGSIEKYLEFAEYITNEKIKKLCRDTRQQARETLDKMQAEGLLR